MFPIGLGVNKRRILARLGVLGVLALVERRVEYGELEEDFDRDVWLDTTGGRIVGALIYGRGLAWLRAQFCI